MSKAPSAASGATDRANGAVSRICEPTCTCSPRIVIRSLRSMRAISSAAAGGARPNLEPSCPVMTCACTSAVTPGMTRTSTSWLLPDGTSSSSRSTSSGPSTTTSPIPCRTASVSSSIPFAFPCSTIRAGSTPALSAVRISPPPATSRPSPSCTITRWTAVQGKAFEAKTTREEGQRAASSIRYSRARRRSADSSTIIAGVPNFSASSSARQPAMISVPSAATALPGGRSSSSLLIVH